MLGQPTTAARYFVDLQMTAYLPRASWPLGRDLVLVATPDIAEMLDEHLRMATERFEQRFAGQEHGYRYRHNLEDMHRTPPLPAAACAALLSAADRLLTVDQPLTLIAELRRLMAYDDRRLGKASWTRTFLGQRPDCSDALLQAVAPLVQPFVRTRKPRGPRRPVRRVAFGAEHVAQLLPQHRHQRDLAQAAEGIAEIHLRRGRAAVLTRGGRLDSAGRGTPRLAARL